MINKIKTLLKDKDKKVLLENFISLSVLQGANYILPLITLPYLVRVLGPEKFGLLAFAQAFAMYFGLFIDYGFNLSATREVSIHRENKKKLSEIFSSVLIIKIGLFIISLMILSIIVFSFEKFRQNWFLYYLVLLPFIGNVIFPFWFFQGIENMKYITMINFISRLIFTILIFLIIKEASDYYLVPVLNFFGGIIGALLSLWIVYKTFKIRFFLVNLQVILDRLKGGFDLFLSSFTSSFYRNFNTVALGILTNDLYVGYYAIAEKIIKIIQLLQGVVGNVLYPYLSKRFSSDYFLFFKLSEKYFKVVVGIYGTIFVVVLIASPIIVYIINGSIQENILLNLRIMSIVIFIGGLNYFYGVIGLLSMGFNGEYTRGVLITSISNIFIVFILAFFLKDIGASIAFVSSEILLLIIFYRYIYLIKTTKINK